MAAENQRWTIEKSLSGADLREIDLDLERENAGQSASLISSAKIIGELFFSANAIVDSEIQGNIESEAELVIEKNAEVIGNINGEEVVIVGKVFGKINASKRLTLKKGAFLKGDIYTKRLIIEDGVVFEGFCDMECAQKAAQ